MTVNTATGPFDSAENDGAGKRFLIRASNILIAFAAVVATSVALHPILPAPFVENVAPKLLFFAAHKNEFDTLFIGTSRIEHHLEPEIFDRVTAERGLPTRSFNLAVDDMHPPENFFVLDQILKMSPHLKWVVLEFEDIQSEPSPGARGTRRLAYWHDWPRTRLALHRIVDPKGNARWYAKLVRAALRHRDLVMHVSLFVKESTNIGRLSELLHDAGQPTRGETQLGPRRDGFRPPRAAMAPSRIAVYERKLQREVTHAHPRYIDPFAERTFREYAARFQQLGTACAFVVTPVVTQSLLRFRPTPAPPGPLFSFNNASTYPQLYRAEVRADESHLTKESADEFTRLFAEEFLRYREKKKL